MANTTQENILIYLQNGNAISPAIAAHEFITPLKNKHKLIN